MSSDEMRYSATESDNNSGEDRELSQFINRRPAASRRARGRRAAKPQRGRTGTARGVRRGARRGRGRVQRTTQEEEDITDSDASEQQNKSNSEDETPDEQQIEEEDEEKTKETKPKSKELIQYNSSETKKTRMKMAAKKTSPVALEGYSAEDEHPSEEQDFTTAPTHDDTSTQEGMKEQEVPSSTPIIISSADTEAQLATFTTTQASIPSQEMLNTEESQQHNDDDSERWAQHTESPNLYTQDGDNERGKLQTGASQQPDTEELLSETNLNEDNQQVKADQLKEKEKVKVVQKALKGKEKKKEPKKEVMKRKGKEKEVQLQAPKKQKVQKHHLGGKQTIIIEDSNEDNLNKLNTRNHPKLFVDTMNALSTEQREWVKSIGFGSLLHLKLQKVPITMAYWVVDKYDVVRCAIRLCDGNCIEVNEEEVERVLGIPRGAESIARGLKGEEHTSIMNEWKEYFSRVDGEGPAYSPKTIDGSRPSHIVDKLIKCKDLLWFKRLFVNFFVSSLIESTQKGTIEKSLLMTNGDNISNMNWCEFVMNSLSQSKLEWREKKDRYYKGPIILLVLLYVDRMLFMGRENPTDTPVFLGWTDKKQFERQENEIRFGGFGRGKLMDKPTERREGRAAKEVNQEKQTTVPTNVQDWMAEFTAKTKVLGKAIVDVERMFSSMPPEFDELSSVKNVVKTAKGMLRRKDDEGRSSNVEFDEVWMDSDHPFWSDPQLIELLRGVEKGYEQQNETAVPASTSAPARDEQDDDIWNAVTEIGVQANEGRSGMADDIVAVDKTPVADDQTKSQLQKRKKTESPGFQLPKFHLISSEEQDVAQTTIQQSTGDTEIEETENAAEEEYERKKKEKAKGKQADVDQALGKRHRGLALTLKSPFKIRYVDPFSRITDQQLAVYKFCCASGFESKYTLYKDVQRQLTDKDLSSMEVEVHSKCIDVWSTTLNKNESDRSPEHPNRLFLYARYAGMNPKGEDTDLKLNVDYGLSLVHQRKMKDIDLIFAPVQEGEEYFLVVVNIKNKNIQVLDSVQNTRGMDYYLPVVSKMATNIGRNMRASCLHKKASFLENASAKPSLVPLPCMSTVDGDYTSGIYTMRHMELYMGNPNEKWEQQMTPRNKDSCIKALCVKYTHKILTSPTNELLEDALAIIENSPVPQSQE